MLSLRAIPPSIAEERKVKVAYADPPYPGCAHLYKGHKDYGGEVDHAKLVAQLEIYDGWLLHTNSVSLKAILPLVPDDARIMAWVKTFAAFKRNVPVAYAWEPVIVKACRKPVVRGHVVMRDWISEPITLQRGLVGVKPKAVCMWAFEVLGMNRDDELVDLFPGTGAVTNAFNEWKTTPTFWEAQVATGGGG